MALLSPPIPLENPGATTRDEAQLYARIEAEYREMPGLTLTLPQAARLFSLETARCERVTRRPRARWPAGAARGDVRAGRLRPPLHLAVCGSKRSA